MIDGIKIDEEDFKKRKAIDRDTIIYRNLSYVVEKVEKLPCKEERVEISGVKTSINRIWTILLLILTGLGGIAFKIFR